MTQQNQFKARTAWLRAFATLAIAILLSSACALPALAELRCRDCPFPMKIGDNKWLMPDSTLVVEIYEQRLMDASYQMSVTLLDSETGDLLASGSARRSKLQRSVTITLLDLHGLPVEGEIKWVNFAKGMIQAKFTCTTNRCSIQKHLSSDR